MNIDAAIIKYDARQAARVAKQAEADARKLGGKSSVRSQDTTAAVRVRGL